MKKYLDHVPVVCLLSSFILTCIYSDKAAYQVGLVVSAVLFAYQQWLFKQESPNYQKKIDQIQQALSYTQEELYKIETKLKEEHKVELAQIKDDIGKMSISLTKVPGVSVGKEKQRIQF